MVFSKDCFNVDTAAKSVIFTEPYFNFASIRDGLNEFLELGSYDTRYSNFFPGTGHI